MVQKPAGVHRCVVVMGNDSRFGESWSLLSDGWSRSKSENHLVILALMMVPTGPGHDKMAPDVTKLNMSMTLTTA